MKLLIFDQFSDPGGAQQGLLDLMPALAAGGWRVLVGLPGAGPMFDRLRPFGCETATVTCGPYTSGRKSAADLVRFAWTTPVLASQMRSLARRYRPDLVYLNGPRLLPAAALAGFDAPVLFHVHSFIGPGAVRRLAGSALRKLDASVTGCCEYVVAPWRPYVRGGRTAVVFNGVAGPFSRLNRTREGPAVAGCIGRIAPEKGQLAFLEAASAIVENLPECRFRVIGAPLFSDASALRYREQVRARAAGLPVEFAGWVEDVQTALQELDILLVPSAAHEATTRVILEAFACGVPVVAFPSGGIPEVVEHGRTGMLAGSVAGMARCAIELLGDRARAEAISRAARESWQRRFTLERYRRQMLDRLQVAVGCRAPATCA